MQIAKLEVAAILPVWIGRPNPNQKIKTFSKFVVTIPMVLSLAPKTAQILSLQICHTPLRSTFSVWPQLPHSLATRCLSFMNIHHQRRNFSDQFPSPGSGAAAQEPTLTQPTLHQADDGRQFMAMELPKFHKKLKPYIVKRRLNKMRTYIGAEKNIRHSPQRMNLVCQLAAGLTLNDAILQLDFCQKRMAPLVKKVLIRTANLADIKDGLQRSQLEVAECFATRGTPLKRIMPMGRGRTGRMEHKHCHFRVVLREIDFKLRIYQAPSLNQKKNWFLKQQDAAADFADASKKREEYEELKRKAEANKAKREAD